MRAERNKEEREGGERGERKRAERKKGEGRWRKLEEDDKMFQRNEEKYRTPEKEKLVIERGKRACKNVRERKIKKCACVRKIEPSKKRNRNKRQFVFLCRELKDQNRDITYTRRKKKTVRKTESEREIEKGRKKDCEKERQEMGEKFNQKQKEREREIKNSEKGREIK